MRFIRSCRVFSVEVEKTAFGGKIQSACVFIDLFYCCPERVCLLRVSCSGTTQYYGGIKKIGHCNPL